jgi:hypothetical protein
MSPLSDPQRHVPHSLDSAVTLGQSAYPNRGAHAVIVAPQ